MVSVGTRAVVGPRLRPLTCPWGSHLSDCLCAGVVLLGKHPDQASGGLLGCLHVAFIVPRHACAVGQGWQGGGVQDIYDDLQGALCFRQLCPDLLVGLWSAGRQTIRWCKAGASLTSFASTTKNNASGCGHITWTRLTRAAPAAA